jgi:protein gp37
MFRDLARYGKDPNKISRTAKNTFEAALKWVNSMRIFTCSWSDFFIAEADEWRKDAWDIIRVTKQHNWLILTKRVERILKCLPEDWGQGWDNVWLGITVENQECADERIPLFLEISAKIKFLSIEPLLGSVDVSKYLHGIQWVIIGGESGNNTGKHLYRPCELEWIESIIKQCKKAGVAVFVKQLGTHLQKEMGLKTRHGSDINEFPKNLQFQEFPKNVNPNYSEKVVVESIVKEAPVQIALETKVTSTSNHKTAEEYVNSLSPFKKELGIAILSGLTPAEAAIKFSQERNMPLKTYRAYATMVENGLKIIKTAP